MLMFVILAFAASGVVYGETSKCQLFGRGSICDDELAGYFDCDGISPVGVYHKCNSGFICGCGIERKCSDSEPRCVKRPNLPKVPMDFIVSFGGQFNITHPQGSNKETLNGIIYQDATKDDEKFLRRTEHRRNGKYLRRVTQLVRKVDGKANYTAYTITELPKGSVFCSASKVDKFRDLFYDLRLFSYEEPNFTYVYRDGPLHAGDNAIVQRWSYGLLHITQFAPQIYTRFDSGSPQSKISTSTRIQYPYFYLLRPHADYFRVPSACANVNVN